MSNIRKQAQFLEQAINTLRNYYHKPIPATNLIHAVITSWKDNPPAYAKSQLQKSSIKSTSNYVDPVFGSVLQRHILDDKLHIRSVTNGSQSPFHPKIIRFVTDTFFDAQNTLSRCARLSLSAAKLASNLHSRGLEVLVVIDAPISGLLLTDESKQTHPYQSNPHWTAPKDNLSLYLPPDPLDYAPALDAVIEDENTKKVVGIVQDAAPLLKPIATLPHSYTIRTSTRLASTYHDISSAAQQASVCKSIIKHDLTRYQSLSKYNVSCIIYVTADAIAANLEILETVAARAQFDQISLFK